MKGDPKNRVSTNITASNYKLNSQLSSSDVARRQENRDVTAQITTAWIANELLKIKFHLTQPE